MKILTKKHVMTDGSEVFNVILTDSENGNHGLIDIPAYSEKCAATLAKALKVAIEANACMTVELR